jgi:hypothetical protein
LGSLAQVIVAVLGIAITVVSIVVQLAATRYTPRIAEMFFKDRTNLGLMGFFVVSSLVAVWVSVVVTGTFVPRATVLVSMGLVTASLVLLVPYFAYVFAFLDPEKVIARIGKHVTDSTKGHALGDALDQAQSQCATGLEHLCDIAINTMAQKDRLIPTHALTAMREFTIDYLGRKHETAPAWFSVGTRLSALPDFISLAPTSVQALEDEHLWVEWKVLRHLRNIFAESLSDLPEMAAVVAIETRYIGEAAIRHGDLPAVALVQKYFNTFLRNAINARNIRACYNLFHQYRILAERVIAQGQDPMASEIAQRFAYYGRTAQNAGLGFATETAAHDLAILCEHAFLKTAPCHDAVLDAFLSIDMEVDRDKEDRTLRGIRKAQIKLAAFYLEHGQKPLAQRIANDMRNEQPERLLSIRAELLAVEHKDFWEITDRGVNFDYLDPRRRATLDEFFAWLSLR